MLILVEESTYEWEICHCINQCFYVLSPCHDIHHNVLGDYLYIDALVFEVCCELSVQEGLFLRP
jgi:hypothetical protein